MTDDQNWNIAARMDKLVEIPYNQVSWDTLSTASGHITLIKIIIAHYATIPVVMGTFICAKCIVGSYVIYVVGIAINLIWRDLIWLE